MKRISPERKQAILSKLLPPYNQPVVLTSKQENVGKSTLYKWLNKLKSEGKLVPGANKTTAQWSNESKFAAIVETATLNQHEVAEYCRQKGLYPEQLAQWKKDFIQTKSSSDNKALKQSQKENKQLKKELIRKEKALAEAAALLVLRKKLAALYGEAEEDD